MFQEAHAFISAEKPEDVTEDRIRAELSKTQTQAPTQWVRRSSRSADKEELVVSLLHYFVCPSDGDRAFHLSIKRLLRQKVRFYKKRFTSNLPVKRNQTFLVSLSLIRFHLYFSLGYKLQKN